MQSRPLWALVSLLVLIAFAVLTLVPPPQAHAKWSSDSPPDDDDSSTTTILIVAGVAVAAAVVIYLIVRDKGDEGEESQSSIQKLVPVADGAAENPVLTALGVRAPDVEPPCPVNLFVGLRSGARGGDDGRLLAGISYSF